MLQELARYLCGQLGVDFTAHGIWIYIVLRLAVAGALFLGGISLAAMFFIWWERKVAGHMQCRLGPMHVGGWHGWAQSLADGVKLLLKEDLVPEGADSFLFRFAPYLAFAPVFAAFLALPFGPQLMFEDGLNIGVLYLLAVLAVEIMGVILAGWASNSKWSVYGAMREACQMVSYEIPLGISIICGVVVAGTLDLMELNYLQGGGIRHWFVFANPFIFAAFLVYFIASLAENKRAPFDLPESESELVAGFHTEYSGLRWSFFFFAEYGAMFVIGGIQASLFMGGWNSPLGPVDPVYRLIGYDAVHAGQAYFNGMIGHATSMAETAQAMGLSTGGLIALNLYCLFWFILKAVGVVFVQMWLRWTLPRIRIDQVLHACVKVLLPASLVTLAGTAVWVWFEQYLRPAGYSEKIIRLEHLTTPASAFPFQSVTQYVLAIIGLGIFFSCVFVVARAYFSRDTQPVKTFFPDVMPVGTEVSFTRTPAPPPAPEAPAATTPTPPAPPAAPVQPA